MREEPQANGAGPGAGRGCGPADTQASRTVLVPSGAWGISPVSALCPLQSHWAGTERAYGFGTLQRTVGS